MYIPGSTYVYIYSDENEQVDLYNLSITYTVSYMSNSNIMQNIRNMGFEGPQDFRIYFRILQFMHILYYIVLYIYLVLQEIVAVLISFRNQD